MASAQPPQALTGGTARSFHRRPLPSPPAVSFSSPEGRALFSEALGEGGMEGYFSLSEQFQTQAEPAFCGLASLAVVLNALSIDPGRQWKGPWRWFDENMLDCCQPLDAVKERGIVIDQVACLGRECTPMGGGADVDDPCTYNDFARDIEEACYGHGATASHVIVGYSRKAFGQTGDGHFSPIGGLNKAKGLVLILDVARFKYPPHWVPLRDLYESMRRIDPDTGRPRGYLVVKSGAGMGRADGAFTLTCRNEGWEGLLQHLTSAPVREAAREVVNNEAPSPEAVALIFDVKIEGRAEHSKDGVPWHSLLEWRPEGGCEGNGKVVRQIEGTRAHASLVRLWPEWAGGGAGGGGGAGEAGEGRPSEAVHLAALCLALDASGRAGLHPSELEGAIVHVASQLGEMQRVCCTPAVAGH